MGRRFPLDNVGTGGARQWASRIECNECGRVAHHVSNSTKHKPPEAVEQYFRKNGWQVGAGPRADKCPKCIEAKHINRNKEPPVAETKEPNVAQMPRTMSREDRKLIFDEINGCYDKEAGRYMDGWHDEKVAKSLGAHVPRAWVSEIREDFFGPSGSNEDFDKFIERMKAINDDLIQLRSMVGQVDERFQRIDSSAADLRKLASDIRRASGLAK